MALQKLKALRSGPNVECPERPVAEAEVVRHAVTAKEKGLLGSKYYTRNPFRRARQRLTSSTVESFTTGQQAIEIAGKRLEMSSTFECNPTATNQTLTVARKLVAEFKKNVAEVRTFLK
jgi:hypothetical protein